MPAPSLPLTPTPDNHLFSAAIGASLYGDPALYNEMTANNSDITLVGGANGGNTFIVYNATDVVVQAPTDGIDTIETKGNGFTLPDNVQNLFLEGTANSYAIGNAGDNLLVANAGNDTLTTNGGNDVMVAGTGSDTFNITIDAGTTTWITQFKTSGNATDHLNLSQYFTSFDQVQTAETQIGDDLQIDLGQGQTVMLQDTSAAALTASTVETGHSLDNAHLVFDDEFDSLSLNDGAPGTGGNIWSTTINGQRVLSSNNEQEVYFDPNFFVRFGINPFSINNGVLTVQAGLIPAADRPTLANAMYYSGALTTQNSFSFEYGYVEASIETPAGQGLWPAFWLLPASGQWPPEIDVMEQIGSNTQQTTSTVHSAVTSPFSNISMMPENLTAGFHTYAMNWTPDTITFYVDGQETMETPTPADLHQPMYLILNLAVGGNWPGLPDATIDWDTAQLKIDYVRVYQDGPPPAPGVILSNAANAADLSQSLSVADTDPGTSTTYAAADLKAAGGTTVTVAYDDNEGVTVTNNGAWNTIKNATISDATSSSVTVNNFVDAEIKLGDGNSIVNVNGAKRGNIATGNGDSTIDVTGGSNGSTQNGVNITVGDGNNTIDFTGTSLDKAVIKLGTGSNDVTLGGQAVATITAAATGATHFTDASTSAGVAITLGSGADVLDVLAGAHLTVTQFDKNLDTIRLDGTSAAQVTVTNLYYNNSTDIHIANGGNIHLVGVQLSTHPTQVTFATDTPLPTT